MTTSDDGSTWSKPLAKGESRKAATPLIEIPLPAGTTARYLRVTQTLDGATGNSWSIHEVGVHGEARK